MCALHKICRPLFQKPSARICQHTPHSPTYYVVVPCLTLNRPGPDTEVLCGLHVVDRRDVSGPDEYRGLGDDPSSYRVLLHAGRLHITESDPASPRP